MITIDGRPSSRLFQDVARETRKAYNCAPVKLWHLSSLYDDWMLLMPEYMLEFAPPFLINQAISYFATSQEVHKLDCLIEISYLESIKDQLTVSPWYGECFEHTDFDSMLDFLPLDLCAGYSFRVIDYVACGHSFVINPNLISAADFQIIV